MEETQKICAVLGGDARQVRLCALLAEDGWQVQTFGLGQQPGPGVKNCLELAQALAGARWAALPMPAEKEGALHAPLAGERIELPGLLEQIGSLSPGCLLLAGLPGKGLCRLAEEKGLRLKEYADEALTRRNAAITAEAALSLTLEKRQRTILGSRCLVIGYGRIGQALAGRLRALGARVTASARKPEDLELARCAGLEAIETAEIVRVLPRQDVIYNTVPALVLGQEQLARCAPRGLILDLASNPGGAGFPQRPGNQVPSLRGENALTGGCDRNDTALPYPK